MSVHVIYYQDGAKIMRPVADEKVYRQLRDSERNKHADKHHMVQMNYSCLPNADGTLKGSTRISKSVGMDIDFDPKAADYEEKMASVPNLVMSKKEELGLLMMERSAGKGYHIAFRRKAGMSQEENLRWASQLLGVEYDKGAKDITRVFFTPPCEKLLFVDKELFDNSEMVNTEAAPGEEKNTEPEKNTKPANPSDSSLFTLPSSLSYLGIPYEEIIRKWWAMYNDGCEPVKNNRNTLTFELAVNLRHICGFDRQLLDKIIPCYDGFPQSEKLACIDSALGEKRTQMPKRLKDVLLAIRQERLMDSDGNQAETDGLDEALAKDDLFYFNSLPKMPMGVKDSVDAVGPHLALPVITAICPAIGMLATGVKVDVHGKMNSLNLISYISGDFASGKGSIDPVIDAWTSEVKQMDKMYQQQEDEWRARKRAAKNKKDQPEEPKLPVRCLTLNNTVANLAERLANTEGKHGLRGKVLGMFFLFHSILYLCIMNMLEQLARLVLPKEILDNFDIVKIETDESDIDSMSLTIHLDERMNAYLQKSEDYESKGFMDAVRITDFPIRDHKVILVLRRRRWRNKETGETFVDRISVTESGTRYSKEFAAFLKETYGHIPDDLPYA